MNTLQGKIGLVVAALAVSATFSAAAAYAEPQFRPGGGSTAVVNCASATYEKAWCEVQGGGDIIDANVTRRLSSAGCDRRDDWDVSDGALWVRNGCRAEFEVVLAGVPGRDDDLAGGPGGYIPPAGQRDAIPDRDYETRDYGTDDRDWRDESERRVAPGRLAQSIAACSREANDVAWDRGAWSAQYADSPRLVETRDRFELRGRMRVHDDRGFHLEDSRCETRRGKVVDFEMD
jgi:hypothetical protein